VYVNGETAVLGHRPSTDPDGDGQSKDHVTAMLNSGVQQLPFTTVLMDSWYATQKIDGALTSWRNDIPSAQVKSAS